MYANAMKRYPKTSSLPTPYIYIPPTMATITYALLSTENLVVDPAPKQRVEFSPVEIRQAVEVGAILLYNCGIVQVSLYTFE